ncbi:unnamed protein product, partial [marine sediment metagenome]
RCGGFTYVMSSSGSKRAVHLDERVLSSWRNLNVTERYFTLFANWQLRSSAEAVAERASAGGAVFSLWHSLFGYILEGGLAVAGSSGHESFLRGFPGTTNLALLHLFGLISLRQGMPEEGKGWCIAEVKRTRFGDALLNVVADFLIDRPSLWIDKQKAFTSFGFLQPLLQPFFPEWQRNIINTETEKKTGSYVFKVSLGIIWLKNCRLPQYAPR